MGTIAFFAHVEPGRHRLGARADATDGEPVLAHVVQADAAEIDRQFFFDAAHHHLEDAAQVLALADGARDARHQRQALHLLAEPRFVLQPLGDVAVVGDDGAHRRVVQQVGGDTLEPDPAAVLVAAAPDQRRSACPGCASSFSTAAPRTGRSSGWVCVGAEAA